MKARRALQLGIVAVGIVIGLVAAPSAKALSGTDFNPGRIMDDSVFFNKDAMSAAEIQAFLQSKVPVCDTYHVPPAGIADNRPWTCLYQYYENTTTHVNNIGAPTTIPAGAISGAQIIYNAAQTYNISPKVLLVLLQKEQSLITDSWPYPSQYRGATGYGCPDTSVCDSQYYGFYNQVTNAARQFRLYANNPSGYNYAAGRNNNILYNPNAACGYQTVYIQNQATAGLYNYTPYVPNAAALNNLYGLGDSCSAYGNRNFWRLYNDWFGSTLIPAYSWELTEQRIKAYITGEDIDISAGIPSGERVILYIKAKNTGTATWVNNGTNPVRVGTSNPTDRASVFCETSWIACHRPSNMVEGSVAPGQVGTFQFAIQAPLAVGSYSEYYNLLAEGASWMNNIGLHFNIKVIPATLSYSLVSSTVPTTITSGQTANGSITVKNTGNVSWFNTVKYPLRLGTSSPNDRTSLFQADNWLAKTRVAAQSEFRVMPQQNATFSVSFKAPATNGTYLEKFALLLEGYQWGATQIPLSFTVSGGLAPSAVLTDTLTAGQSLGVNQSLRSINGAYRLTLQGDGNLVLYANSTKHVLWMTGTQGKSVVRLVMQGDGNLVLYNSSGKYVWGTATNGMGANHLVMQNDGNLVLFTSANKAVWTTGTAGRL